jgi:hypothetical protein
MKMIVNASKLGKTARRGDEKSIQSAFRLPCYQERERIEEFTVVFRNSLKAAACNSIILQGAARKSLVQAARQQSFRMREPGR